MHSPNNHLLYLEPNSRRIQTAGRYPKDQNIALRNILDTNNKTPLSALQIQIGLPTIKETRCTRGVHVVFSVTRMRSNNSARINKSDFTTEKIV